MRRSGDAGRRGAAPSAPSAPSARVRSVRSVRSCSLRLLRPLPTLTFALIILLLAACTHAPQAPVQATLQGVEPLREEPAAGFARATTPRRFHFPRDHGPHPQYHIEWWYYTGNLATPDGRRFGYQLTFFRQALQPAPPQRASEWATRNSYMAHLAISDVEAQRFYAVDRFSRDAVGLAGAQGQPYHVFLEDWSARGSGPQGMTMILSAAQDTIALDLTLESRKPPVLQGNDGLSQKGAAPGNASYYYSLTRMATSGHLRVGDTTYLVQGFSWMDHEFGTSALDTGALGWDWFSLQFDDGRELMLWRIRLAEGTAPSPAPADALLVLADGTTRRLDASAIQITVLDTWQSPHTGIVYPSGWRLSVPEEALVLDIEPLLRDQELYATAVVYWEGAVRLSGTYRDAPLYGYGYVELTGYSAPTPRSPRRALPDQ
jgi:predicted secreted hydrolase